MSAVGNTRQIWVGLSRYLVAETSAMFSIDVDIEMLAERIEGANGIEKILVAWMGGGFFDGLGIIIYSEPNDGPQTLIQQDDPRHEDAAERFRKALYERAPEWADALSPVVYMNITSRYLNITSRYL